MSLSPYQAMWLLVLFDLPVDSKSARKQYARFRKELLRDGFTMLQYSVYARFCASEEAAQVHRKTVREGLPPEGQVRIVTLTDIQFGRMEVYLGESAKEPEKKPLQLEFF